METLTVQDAVDRAKNLHLQVQTATFQKMEDDLQRDIKALQDWAASEEERKKNWNSMVLTRKRKRYVKGLACVRDFCSSTLRIKTAELAATEMELASFRAAAETAYPVQGNKKFLSQQIPHLPGEGC